jgi:MFS family permease
MTEAILTAEPIAAAGAPSFSIARRNYILFVLTLIGTLNLLDRQILTILIEPIRKELSLSDTQIGLLVGIAFTFVYVTCGIPVSRLADAWSRRKVIAIAVAAWSAMTALCGTAQNFSQLLLARMGVGVGESGGSPSCQAFVSDLFPRHQRATALSFYLISVPLGIGLGLVVGGCAVERIGWRWTFSLAAAPGLIAAALMWLTVPEVRQGLTDGAPEKAAALPYFKTVRLLLATGSFRNMMLASTLHGFLSLGISNWLPSFLARSHGLDPHTIGIKLALVYAGPHFVGILLGGRLADLWGRRDARWYLWIPAIATPASAAMYACAFVAPTAYIFWFMPVSTFFISTLAGTSILITQNLSPVAFRASATATILFVINLVSLGLGPQFVGIFSDMLRPAYGEESLRMTLLFATTIAIPAGLLFLRASQTYRADLIAADARNKASSPQS